MYPMPIIRISFFLVRLLFVMPIFALAAPELWLITCDYAWVPVAVNVGTRSSAMIISGDLLSRRLFGVQMSLFAGNWNNGW